MNEQIKRLAEQAKIFTYNKYYDPIPASILSNGSEVQKFAELIIEECLHELESVDTGDYAGDDWDKGYDAGLLQARIVLKEYFGFE